MLHAATKAAAGVLIVGVLSACGTPPASTGGASGASSSPVASTSATSVMTARQMCQTAFSGSEVLSWASSTVAEFQQYQYGGPTPMRPLAGSFSDLPGDARGAWCGVRAGAETTRWWAVVPGRGPVKAIEITGPGEGAARGEAQGPPVVP